MFNGKNKAITFSYDDAVTQDIRLIEILNKYNLKATFNINSKLLGTELYLMLGDKKVSAIKNKPQDIKYIYQGHEVAAHTLTHPHLPEIEEDKEIIRQVEEDRLNLTDIVGYEVMGMAYPGGPPNCNDHVAEIIKNNTNIKYARSFCVDESFDVDKDMYQFQGTISHWENWDSFFEFGEKFLNLQTDKPQLLYIWGHSFELDVEPRRWERFEEFCKLISGKDNIFYGTNIEVFETLWKKV